MDNTKEITRRLADLASKSLEVGIQGEEAEAYHVDENGKRTARMVVIAGANEFGANTGRSVIPERPFIRGTFDKHEDDIESDCIKVFGQVVDGNYSAQTGFDALGQDFVGKVQTYLTELSDPPNAPVTIALKGSSNPLIDTGRLRNSITYKVGDNDGEG